MLDAVFCEPSHDITFFINYKEVGLQHLFQYAHLIYRRHILLISNNKDLHVVIWFLTVE